MDLQLKGKSVIVTAASKGLGKATALQFAKEGAHVIISSRSEDDLEQAVEMIKKESENENVHYTVCDMTNPNEIDHLIDKTIELYGKIDVLINNAGGPPAGKFDDFTDQDWQHAYELNLLSFIRSIRASLPYMREVGEGRIINIASSSIKQTLDNLILSNTFRAGLVGLSKSLSQELAKEEILINTVGPGIIKTDRIEELYKFRADKEGETIEDLLEKDEKNIAIGRYGQPEEFAKAVVFLASFANTYVTGQSFVVDGGMVKAL